MNDVAGNEPQSAVADKPHEDDVSFDLNVKDIAVELVRHFWDLLRQIGGRR